MAATLTGQRFSGPEWTFERKYDGIRLLAYKNGPAVELYSRNRLPLHFPEVASTLAALPVRELVLDGEATHGEHSRSYHVFDVLWIDGEDLTSQPIEARRARLSSLPLSPPLEPVPLLTTDRPWEQACKEGWEGVIAKRQGSLYEQRRSPHWLKMKCETVRNFLVGGFTEPQGGRVGFGALLIGYFDGADFVFAGKLGTGFDRATLLALRTRLDRLEIPSRAFTRGDGFPRSGVHWVRPEVTVRAAFIEWTTHGKLRHPRCLEVVSQPPDVP